MKITKIIKTLPGILLICMLFSPNLSAQGHFEFGFHFGSWNINILRSTIEEGISDALEEDLKDEFLEKIREDHPDMFDTSYSHDVSFESSGQNYGFEVRWYPGGETGSFSLGLSIEKTRMRVSLPSISASLTLEEQGTGKTASFQGTVRDARFDMDPLSFHLSFRWDIKPSWRVNPYITFGFGAATGSELEEAQFRASYTGDLNIQGEDPEHYSDSVIKTLKELRDDLEEEGEEFFIPGFLPFIQLNLGVKGAITKNIFILVDAGVWNGFLFRGGIAFRI